MEVTRIGKVSILPDIVGSHPGVTELRNTVSQWLKQWTKFWIFASVPVNNLQSGSMIWFLLFLEHLQPTGNKLLSYSSETMKIIVGNTFNCFEQNQPANICWTLHCVQIVAAVQSHGNRHLGDARWARTWIPVPALSLFNFMILGNAPSALSCIHKG